MIQENFYRSAYDGNKQFKQHDVKTANATGFGAAADDFMERGIDLNEQLIMNKPATFFFRMNSNAMETSHIYMDDVLIVDRSIKAVNGKIIVASVNGELVVRRYQQSFNKAMLTTEDKKYKDIQIDEFTQFQSYGVVTCSIHLIDISLINFNAPNP
jgi:DNA polymerase V